ncbi:hypothetical protein BCR42DRAFT_416805 [Absidia repens]|uniref:CCR4-NOT transcription complex subunit 11 n=1 Tax=Absidia repens TaxID=90262 RepID=A0A1X2IF01_9FUNG|nr:hypothetical protein BCR42DRAFT_416805 [Absidia repens]
MLVGKDAESFGTVFRLYKEKNLSTSLFTSACNVFLVFDQTSVVTERLVILYILYAYYADVPLEQNPFLTFFLEFVDQQNVTLLRGDWIEQHFVCAILEGCMDKVESLTPLDVFQQPDVYIPLLHQSPPALEKLKYNVGCLIDHPDLDETPVKTATENDDDDNDDDNLSNANQERRVSHYLILIQNQATKLDQKVIKFLSGLLLQATKRTLTIPENEVLIHAMKLHPYVAGLLPLAPKELPTLIELNHFLAVDLVPILLNGSVTNAYLYFLSQPKITCNSMEVIHHVLTTHHQALPDDFLHTYISNAIRTCELLEGSWQERHVRMVAKFLQSLLDSQILPIADYMIEIKTFCLSYLKIRGVASLFRTVSLEVV